MHRIMIFVDGSNVVGVLRRMTLRVDNYEAFYRHILQQATDVWWTCTVGTAKPLARLVRVLWYAVGDLDHWDLNDARVQATLREAFDKDREMRSSFMALAGQKLQGASQSEVAKEAWAMCFQAIREWYEKRCDLVDGFRRFYHSIRSTTDFIDVIECAHWKLDVLRRETAEKGLDTRLAVDMVTLVDSYDVAILLSGDADNIPSLDYVKARGKQVGVVEFLGGYPPEKKSAHASSRLKVAADFVVPIYEMDLVQKGLAAKSISGTG
jgi:uncharacterized LabA/DUF88 family protein